MGFSNEMDDGQDLNILLSRRLGVQRAPSPNVASELFPSIVLELERVEWGFLGGERTFERWIKSAATVAKFGSCGVMNEPGTGVLGVVKRFSGLAVTSGVLQWGYGPTVGTGVPGFACDSRISGTPSAPATGGVQSSLRINNNLNDSTPVWSIQLGEYKHTAGLSFTIQGPWVVAPGSAFWVSHNTADKELSVAFRWTERSANSSELQSAGSFE